MHLFGTLFEETISEFLKKSLDYRSNCRILKSPMSLDSRKNFNCRFFVYCKIMTTKGEDFFFPHYFFDYVVLHLINHEKLS